MKELLFRYIARLLICLIISSTVACSTIKTQKSVLIDPKIPAIQPSRLTQVIKKYQQEIPQKMRQEKIPGLAIAIVDAQRVLWMKGFGFTNKEQKRPITTDTIFSIQSTSKTITSTAIMIAVQQGLLDLDQPVKKYLPSFTINSREEKNPAQHLTLRQLLSHTGGLTHEAPVGNNFDPHSPSFEAHVRSISETWLRYPIGQRYSYSNLGIDLAGYILQIASGKPFHQYVRENLLVPLGMTHSSFDMDVIKNIANRALGHSKSFAKVPLEIPMIPSGGFYASASDMARFIQFHLNHGKTVNGQLELAKKYLDEMYRIPLPIKGQIKGYALGIDSIKRKGKTYFNHGGGGFGFLSDMIWSLELGLGITILTNSTDHTLQWTLATQILDDLSGKDSATKPPQNTADQVDQQKHFLDDKTANPSLASRYLGIYVGPKGILNLEVRNGYLGRELDGKFLPWHFKSSAEVLEQRPDTTFRYRFTLSDAGAPRHITRVEDGTWWDYNEGPYDTFGPDKTSWKAFEGEYGYKIWGVPKGTVKVYRKNGYLYLDEYRLTEYQPGLFFSADGEALDFRGSKVRWTNIELSKIQ